MTREVRRWYLNFIFYVLVLVLSIIPILAKLKIIFATLRLTQHTFVTHSLNNPTAFKRSQAQSSENMISLPSFTQTDVIDGFVALGKQSQLLSDSNRKS